MNGKGAYHLCGCGWDGIYNIVITQYTPRPRALQVQIDMCHAQRHTTTQGCYDILLFTFTTALLYLCRYLCLSVSLSVPLSLLPGPAIHRRPLAPVRIRQSAVLSLQQSRLVAHEHRRGPPDLYQGNAGHKRAGGDKQGRFGRLEGDSIGVRGRSELEEGSRGALRRPELWVEGLGRFVIFGAGFSVVEERGRQVTQRVLGALAAPRSDSSMSSSVLSSASSDEESAEGVEESDGKEPGHEDVEEVKGTPRGCSPAVPEGRPATAKEMPHT